MTMHTDESWAAHRQQRAQYDVNHALHAELVARAQLMRMLLKQQAIKAQENSQS